MTIIAGMMMGMEMTVAIETTIHHHRKTVTKKAVILLMESMIDMTPILISSMSMSSVAVAAVVEEAVVVMDIMTRKVDTVPSTMTMMITMTVVKEEGGGVNLSTPPLNHHRPSLQLQY